MDKLIQSVERLLLRYQEQVRSQALLQEQLQQAQHERDLLQSRLQAARARIDTLLAKLQTAAVDSSSTEASLGQQGDML